MRRTSGRAVKQPDRLIDEQSKQESDERQLDDIESEWKFNKLRALSGGWRELRQLP